MARLRHLCFLLLAFTAVSTSGALGVEGIDVSGGLIWIGNAEPQGAPSPLLSTVGVSVPLRITPLLLLSPSLWFHGTQYGLAFGTTKVVPVEDEFADAVWVLSVVVEPAIVLDVPLSPALSVGALAAPAFLLRVPTVAWQEGEAQRAEIAAYQFGRGRFFYPQVGAHLVWRFAEDLALLAQFRAYLPLFHIWDAEGYPFYDQLMAQGTVGIRVSLGGRNRAAGGAP